jgi:FkbM family methyltransferase
MKTTSSDAMLKPFLGKWDISRISSVPRKVPSNVNLFGSQISFPDGYWFLHSMKEIFVEEVYKFQCRKADPFVIDCGANIGLSVIYFKRRFPQSKIIAFEPDAAIFQTLKGNIAQFDYEDVQLINKGVWEKETTLSFLAEGTLGGRVVDDRASSCRSDIISIQTVRLKDYLRDQVDFLKIDIEGAEYEVLLDCADFLNNVQYLFVEYHSTASESQKLDEILSIITNSGFRYYIKEASRNVRHPFVEKNRNWFDLQLNIFCFRS